MIRKYAGIIFFGILIVVAGCSSGAKELEKYLDGDRMQIEEAFMAVNEEMDQLSKHLMDYDSEAALDLLETSIVPDMEAIVEQAGKTEVKHEDISELHKSLEGLVVAQLERDNKLLGIFQELKKMEEADPEVIDAKMEEIYDSNEEYEEAGKSYNKAMEQLTDTYEIEWEEGDPPSIETSSIAEANDDMDLAVLYFMDGLDVDSNHVIEADDDVESDEDKSGTKQVEEEIVQLLKDQGNPAIAFAGEVEVDDSILVTGKSNLKEGEVVSFRAWEYGSEDSTLRDETEVDASGDFKFEVGIEEAANLDGRPFEIEVAYYPESDDKARVELGEENKIIEGPFVRKYTDAKRTRYAAFANATLELKEGEKVAFDTPMWEDTSPNGELDIQMEKASVDVKDDYYDVIMNSNLNELTRVTANVEIPGYEIAGANSRAYVMPDGSFRMQIPRPDVDSDEVYINFEAVADAAIETEELYGENGEHFTGDLTEKSKKGQKIVYQLRLGK